ncbi:MAG: cytochrome c biogenesis heme-transporting ATPase CcmA [Pseudomonadota bacterium]|nr:cytochrome c biogenesis heme-transporting ATPase CcmA [Pseudomonadota bacterium]
MLEAQDLAARRGDAQLFSGVSFALGAGTALFVRGPNGSGKTTLLRILAGTTEAAEGRVLWRGQQVGPFHPALRACAVFIGHAPALKDELTAEENLVSLTTLQGAPAERAAMLDALHAWSLSAHRALPARALSQGQRRRISLARLRLLSRPLWLLDEPTTALDDAGCVTLRDMLAGHLAAGGLAVIATHQDLTVASGTHQSLWLG